MDTAKWLTLLVNLIFGCAALAVAAAMEFSAAAGMPAADLSVRQTNSPMLVRTMGVIVCTVTNEGNVPATDAALNVTLRGTFTLLSVTNTQGSCANSAGTLTCSLGDLPGGGLAEVRLIILPQSASKLTNEIIVTTHAVELDLSDNASTNILGVAGIAQFTLVPTDQTVLSGSDVSFAARAFGTGTVAYQWSSNGVDIAGATNSIFTLSNVQPAQAGLYAVVAVDADGAQLRALAQLTVLVLPAIAMPPVAVITNLGSNVTFSAVATGTPPLIYQWRLNHENIPGATNSTLTITNVQVSNAGSYSVVVKNAAGAAASNPVLLLVTNHNIFVLAAASDFAQRVSLPFNLPFTVRGTNAPGKEENERNHAGKPGGSSVWYSWHALANGIATLDTRGSAFDTLLAVYVGSDLGSLQELDSDDDRGGFFTSEVRFNAQAGQDYVIAIDGLGGQIGPFYLTGHFEATLDMLPVIFNQPASRTVHPGDPAFFGVFALGAISYQWFFNGQPIPGANNPSLNIGSVTASNVGNYTVGLTNSLQRGILSKVAALEIGPDPVLRSRDKLEDLISPGGPNDTLPARGAFAMAASPEFGNFISVSVGLPDTQIFNNTQARSDDVNPCYHISQASKWWGLRAVSAGIFDLDTVGSEIGTVLAVYSYPFGCVSGCANDNTFLICSNAAAPGQPSSLRFPAVANGRYMVFVDGLNGATGYIQLTWKLGVPPQLASEPTNHLVIVDPGGTVTLNAGVSQTTQPAPTYLWLSNNTVLTWASTGTLVLPDVPLQSTIYTVIVSNLLGVVTNFWCVIVGEGPRLDYELFRTTETFLGTSIELTHFRVAAPGVPAFVLEASPVINCRECWRPIGTNSGASPLFEFVFPNAHQFTRQFFRARCP